MARGNVKGSPRSLGMILWGWILWFGQGPLVPIRAIENLILNQVFLSNIKGLNKQQSKLKFWIKHI